MRLVWNVALIWRDRWHRNNAHRNIFTKKFIVILWRNSDKKTIVKLWKKSTSICNVPYCKDARHWFDMLISFLLIIVSLVSISVFIINLSIYWVHFSAEFRSFLKCHLICIKCSHACKVQHASSILISKTLCMKLWFQNQSLLVGYRKIWIFYMNLLFEL